MKSARHLWVCLLLANACAGCAFGPRVLERSHGQYNESVKQVAEEQLLLNIVRLRYDDNPMRLDISAIAAQYELGGSLEARPFFAAQATSTLFQPYSRILPFAGLEGANRPTISLTPLDDPESIRSLFRPSTLDGIIFLAETSWPVATMFRLWGEHMNRLPNAPTTSGPPRDVVPEFHAYQSAAHLLQVLQDRGELRFVREEKLTEVGTPLPAGKISAEAQVEAAKNGLEYREKPDKTWALTRRDRRLMLRFALPALDTPEVHDLCRLLNLKPGQASYELTVGGSGDSAARMGEDTTINLYPRSTQQALFYLAHGVAVPDAHLQCGLVQTAQGADGQIFDWSQVTQGLFAVHSVKQHRRPCHAAVAVEYRGWWFYIDDRDHDTKQTFALMMIMTRANLLEAKKGGPTLTLPVGR
jgi:hypothetical protein